MSCLYSLTCVTLEFVEVCGGGETSVELILAGDIVCVCVAFSHLAFVCLSLTIVWNVHALDNTNTNFLVF